MADKNNDSIYHYTNLSGLKGILSNKTIWLTHFNFLNDPFEFKCQHLSSRKDITLNLLELLPSSFVPFIISFSLDFDSYPLWSNYTNHYGFNIEFDIQKLVANTAKFNSKYCDNLFPNYFRNNIMSYDIDYQKKFINEITDKNLPIWKKIISDLIENNPEFKAKNVNDVMKIMAENKKYAEEINSNPNFISIFKNIAELFNSVMFFKPKSLCTEKEYRFTFIAHVKHVHDFLKFRQNNNLLIPYIEIPINLDDKKLNPIKSITLGPKSKSKISRNSIELFRDSLKLDFKIHESDINLR